MYVEQFARMIAYEEDLPLLLQAHSMMVPCRAIWTRRRFKRIRRFQVRRNRADPFKLPVTVSPFKKHWKKTMEFYGILVDANGTWKGFMNPLQGCIPMDSLNIFQYSLGG